LKAQLAIEPSVFESSTRSRGLEGARLDASIGGVPERSPWNRHARQWRHVASPLRPCNEDVQVVQAALDEMAARMSAGVQALLLGVTPELTHLSWPSGSFLHAADANAEMIAQHWNPPVPIESKVTLARWQSLQLDPASLDIVLADGSLTVLPDLAAIRTVLRRMASALRPQGRFVLRAFVKPDEPETPESVVEDMLNGRIGNVHIAKWRLAMALQRSLAGGVELHRVWTAFHSAVPSVTRLASTTGWSVDSIRTLESYRDVRVRYFFPTLTELRGMLAERFDEIACYRPSYELGERCPTLVLQPVGRVMT